MNSLFALMFFAGLIAVLGGVGTIETSTGTPYLMQGIGTAIIGLLLMGSSVLLLNTMGDKNDY